MGNFLSKIADFVNPLKVVGDAVNSIASPIVSLVNDHKNRDLQKLTNYQNQQNFEKQLEFNSAEATAQRNWSAQQADISRQFDTSERLAQQAWQEQMIQQQNEYNSPKAMIERMRAAGVSPATYDGVASSASPTGIPSGSSVGVPSGASASAPTAPHLSAPRYDFDLAATRLMTAQAQKAESESNLSKTQGERLKALLAGELQIQGSTYNVQMSQSMKNEASAKESLANVEKINAQKDVVFAQLDEIRQNISNLEKQGQLTQKELDSYETRLAVELRERLSRIELNGKSALACLASASASYASADLSRAQASLTRTEEEKVCKEIVHQAISNDILKIDYRIKNNTEVSTCVLQNKRNNQAINDISVTNQDDWRYPRLFLQTIGEVFSSNLSIK